MVAILPANGPVLQAVLDTRMFAFTLVLGLLTSIAFGLFPQCMPCARRSPAV
jgi:hypothetical protein